MKAWLREHHAAYLAVIAIIVAALMLSHEIASKQWTEKVVQKQTVQETVKQTVVKPTTDITKTVVQPATWR